MRGYQAPGKRHIPTDSQKRFATLSRGRRTKIATAASTSLIKADQWARGAGVDAAIATAIETHLDKLKRPS